MRIGFVELVLLLFIASLTVGPNVALFVDRWLRRAQRTSAAAARRKAQLEAQAAIEREALLTRFRVASNIFALLLLAAVWGGSVIWFAPVISEALCLVMALVFMTRFWRKTPDPAQIS